MDRALVECLLIGFAGGAFAPRCHPEADVLRPKDLSIYCEHSSFAEKAAAQDDKLR